MKQKESEEYWNDILEKFGRHKGTITSFCKKHNVNIHRLYHRRKKFNNKVESTFHAIDLRSTSIPEVKAANVQNAPVPSNEIRIEIGRAKIYITNTDKVSLSNVLKELTVNC